MRPSSALVLWLSLFSATQLLAQPVIDWAAPLPNDPELRIGKLENGFTYYIRENRKPEARALLRLVVNVGSLQEEEEERGLAHFLEHMAFNGSKNFDGPEIFNFLEGVGMKLGAHVNATTSFDETIYNLEIPLDDPETVEKAFLILEDWASNIVFEEDEIEKERGVVIEERRMRSGIGQRLREKQAPYLYFGSKYAERNPIGAAPVIESLSREQLVEFYRKWYRPDLMAVVAVGDFSADEIEARIKARFAHLENPEDAPARVESPIVGHEETFFSIETDPELSRSSMTILIKTDSMAVGTARQYRENLVERIYFAMMNARLAERAQQERPPFMGAGVGRAPLGRGKAMYQMGLGFIGDDYEGGLRALMQEVNRAHNHGFTQTELDRAKANVLSGLERRFSDRDKLHSGRFLHECISHFLVGDAIPGLAKELELTRAVLKDLSLEEVTGVGQFVDQSSDRVVLFTAPERKGYKKPTPEQLLAALSLSLDDELAAYEDPLSDTALLSTNPMPGGVVKEVYHESIDTYDWTLSNGARVIVKSTDFRNDEILMTAFSPGGLSVLSDEDYASGKFAVPIAAQSGLGAFNPTELRKMLAGKNLRLNANIDDHYETLKGWTANKDLGTFFQLIYMQFREPRLDLAAFSSWKERMLAAVENRLKLSRAVFDDVVNEELYRGHLRHRPISRDVIEEIDPERSLELLQDRYGDASDFTFVFVGSIDRDLLKSYVTEYIASLPDLGRVEAGRFTGDTRTEGQLRVKVVRSRGDKSIVRVMFHGEAVWTPEDANSLGAAKAILNMRLRERLREEEGKVYDAEAFAELIRLPRGGFATGFSFSCEVNNADELIALARAEIKALQEEGPLEREMKKKRQQGIRTHQRGKRENGYWMATFARHLQEGRPLDAILTNLPVARELKAEDLQRAAQLYFDDTNMVIAKLDPLPSVAAD